MVRRAHAVRFALVNLMIFAVTLFVVQVAAWAIEEQECQRPDQNEHACDELPDDAIFSCPEEKKKEKCGSWKLYEINAFPQGVVKADAGLTTEEQGDCKRYAQCYWDETLSPPQCNKDIWTPFSQQLKIVPKFNPPCPEPKSE